MKENRKKLIYLGVALFLIGTFLIINQERCNFFFSNLATIQEENPEPLSYLDEMPIDGITKEREVIQPLTFDRRVGHIGVKIGTYGRENHAIYEISLLDQWGNVLGMAREDAAAMKDNDYFYIKVERLIVPGQEYYLKIISDSAEDENAITCYASKSIENQKPVRINGKEQDYSLILTFMYGKVKNYTSAILAVLLFVYVMYAGYCLIKKEKILPFIMTGKTIFLSKQMHLAVIVISIVAFCAALFCKKTIYEILFTEDSHAETYISEALLDDVTAEQSFIYPEEEMDCIEVRFALFLQKFQSGVIHFELYETGNLDVIRSGFVKAKDLENEYVRFSFPKIEGAKGKEYTLRIYTTEVKSDNAMSLFFSSDSFNQQEFQLHGEAVKGNLLLTAGVTQKEFYWEWILVLGMVLLGMILFYFWRFYIAKRKLVAVIGVVFAIVVGGIGVQSYSVYHKFSIDGIIKTIFENSSGREKIYNQEGIDYKESFDYSIRTDGTCYGMTQMIELQNINSKIDSIRIRLKNDSMAKRSYYVSIFFDTGSGYNNDEKYNVFYIYRGESEILIPILNRNLIHSMRIDIGEEIYIETIKWNKKLIEIDEIVLNHSNLREENSYFLWTVTFVIVFILGIFISKKFKKLEKMTITFFLAAGFVYGIIFSVLIPIAQVPDEAYHVRHTLYAIGGDEIYKQMMEITEEVGLFKITGMSGEKVDTLKYKSLFTTRLESYKLNHIVEKDTLEVLKRPGQTIGVLIAILFKMPVFWIYFLGELGGLFVYIGICYCALRLLPRKKELMCMIMLLPIALQQGGSFSYDSFNNALSFLLISYIMYLNVKKEFVDLKDIVVLISIGLLLFYIKTIYAGLLLLFVVVPVDKYNIKIRRYCIDKQWIKANRKKVIAGVCIGILLIIAFVLMMKYEYVILLVQAFIYMGEIIRLVGRSFIEQGNMYIDSMIACFGWADTPVSEWFVIVYVFGLIWLWWFSDKEDEIDKNSKINAKSKIIEKSVVLFTIVIMLSVIMLSMLNWSFGIQAVSEVTPFYNKLKLLNTINGVQGRYFIPILPLILFISGKKKQAMKPQRKIFIFILMLLVSIVYSVFILLHRYWI